MDHKVTAVSEQSPLLRQTRRSSWFHEFQWLLQNSLPVSGTYLLNFTLKLAGVFALGRLGHKELAASALGSMVSSVTAFSITYGASSALDTLCSQAWTGARDKTLLGIYLQRAILILSVIYIPITILWLNATPLLRFLKQDPEIASYAGLYLRYLALGAPAYSLFEALRKYLQAQGIMHASTYVLMIVSPFNFVLTYVLTFNQTLSLGFVGVPIASSISFWIMFLLLVGYTRYVQGYEGWGGWHRACLAEWKPFFGLAIPGIVNAGLEWWCYEIISLGASYLGTNELAAQSILLSTFGVTSTLPWGITIAVATRVGNALGQGDAAHAKRAATAACLLALAFGSLLAVLILDARTSYGYLFTPDTDIVSIVASTLPLFALFQMANGVATTCTGILRGLGQPYITSYLHIFAYCGIGLPTSLTLTFVVNGSLLGLWSGICAALFVSAATHWLYISRLDWSKQADATAKRIQHDETCI